MDINFNLEADADAGAEMIVLHPVTGEETDAKITFRGADSKVFREVKTRIAERLADKKAPKAQQNEVRAEALAGITVFWKNIKDGKKAIDLTPDAAKSLYMSQEWLMVQADLFVSDRANFFGNASKG